MKDLISIIIPTLNEQPFIVNTLLHLQPLRAAGTEIIVVDGGSQDNTRQLAEPLVDYFIEVSKGRAQQMNEGARHAKGKVLLFLHADTVLPNQADMRILIGLVSTGRMWGRFNVQLSGHHRMFRVIERMMNLRSCLTGIATGDQAIFIRRDLFEKIQGFPEIPLMEDIAISKQLKRLSRPLCLRDPVITSSRRWEQNGIWKTIFLMWRLRFAYSVGIKPEKLKKRYTEHSQKD